MAETVRVSMIHPQSFRASKNDPYIHYRPGPDHIVEMPLEHAEAMGLRHRIVKRTTAPDAPVERMAFDGAFDEKLTTILTDAGYKTLEDLGRATRDQLTAIAGVGPANYERIQNAVRGG